MLTKLLAGAALLGVVILICIQLYSIRLAGSFVPQIIRDMRRNKWVAVGWALMAICSFAVWWVWYDLHSVPLTALCALALLAGIVLALYLPAREDLRE